MGSFGAVRPTASPQRGRQLKRLQREWSLLQDADDWTVLGVPSTAEAAQIERAALRMKARYSAIQRDPGLSKEGQRLAAQIGQRVEQSIERIRAGAPRRAAPPPTRDPRALAFDLGVEALEAGQYAKAARYFTTARQDDPSSARNMGYLGWAIYNDPDRPAEARREDGRDLLQLSDSFDSAIDEIQYFLASTEFDAGEHRLARARLRRLLSRTADHADARALMRKVQRAQTED